MFNENQLIFDEVVWHTLMMPTFWGTLCVIGLPAGCDNEKLFPNNLAQVNAAKGYGLGLRLNFRTRL